MTLAVPILSNPSHASFPASFYLTRSSTRKPLNDAAPISSTCGRGILLHPPKSRIKIV